MTKLTGVLTSRKFWASVAALAVIVFGDRAGLTAAEVVPAAATIVAYILGTALEDGLKGRG